MHFYFKFSHWNAYFKHIRNIFNVFDQFLVDFEKFWFFQKIQDGHHKINMASYDVIIKY